MNEDVNVSQPAEGKDKQSSSDTQESYFLDTSSPNTARIFNYLLGGAANFKADRQAAREMLKAIPSLRKWVRLRHAFVQEATQQLYSKGFKQFLDLGSGMPAEDHIHAFAPGAHIIYSDLNPVAVSYGNSLFAELEYVEYIQGDVRNIGEILNAPAVHKLIDRKQKVAIGLNAIPLFLSPAENQQLAQALFKWAPPDSILFVVFQTKGDDKEAESYKQFQSIAAKAGLPIQLYPLEQMIEVMKPWEIARLEPIADFLGLPDNFVTEADKGDVDIALYAAFLSQEMSPF